MCCPSSTKRRWWALAFLWCRDMVGDTTVGGPGIRWHVQDAGVAWALLAAAVEAVPMRCASSREQRCTPDNPGETCIAGESQRRLQLGREKGDLEMKRRGG